MPNPDGSSRSFETYRYYPPTEESDPMITDEEQAAIKEDDREEQVVQQDQISNLIAERGQVYGPNPFNQETVAQAWKATLEAHFQIKLPGPIPGHIVALMMVQLKVLRAACPFSYHQDNYDDLHGYGKIAEICAKANNPKEEMMLRAYGAGEVVSEQSKKGL